MPYSYDDILKAYAAVGVAKGGVVLATGNLGRLMDFDRPGKQAVIEAHYQALRELLGEAGTLVAPTASTDICNTDTPFDPATTPTHLGPFCDYVRKLPATVRSFHPFVSYAAIGPLAERICANVTRHAFGPETPEARLVELNALHVSFGIHSRFSTATNHHVEMLMGVPYRYVREYEHPVVRDGQVARELFYMHVRYMAADVVRDYNEKIFAHFERSHSVAQAPLGRGHVYAYRIGEFAQDMIGALSKDIYLWTNKPPKPDIYRSMM